MILLSLRTRSMLQSKCSFYFLLFINVFAVAVILSSVVCVLKKLNDPKGFLVYNVMYSSPETPAMGFFH